MKEYIKIIIFQIIIIRGNCLNYFLESGSIGPVWVKNVFNYLNFGFLFLFFFKII